MYPFSGFSLSNTQGWLTVLVAFPLIGLALWGLNTFLLNRLKNGKADYSKEGFRRRARLVTAAVMAVIILAAILQYLVFD